LNGNAWFREGRLIGPAGLSAANGDAVFAFLDATYDPADRVATGTIAFSGGTGRFAEAQGSADVLFILGDGWEFEIYLAGSIDY
jgi:hypothetical protein